mmetsp:Transcript_18620/g.52022  ORF Transcript_18620/g.52022 Transcript_18620/m.52022 type:complete len:234 (+) Transcript_18620:468-1169(+)
MGCLLQFLDPTIEPIPFELPYRLVLGQYVNEFELHLELVLLEALDALVQGSSFDLPWLFRQRCGRPTFSRLLPNSRSGLACLCTFTFSRARCLCNSTRQRLETILEIFNHGHELLDFGVGGRNGCFLDLVPSCQRSGACQEILVLLPDLHDLECHGVVLLRCGFELGSGIVQQSFVFEELAINGYGFQLESSLQVARKLLLGSKLFSCHTKFFGKAVVSRWRRRNERAFLRIG